jgi:hypothetical protein
MNINTPFWPRIEHVNGQVTTVIDGLIIAFFLDVDKCTDPDPARRSFEEFFRGVGKNRLNFYVDDEGYTEPLPTDKMRIVQKRVVERTVSGDIVDLLLLDTDQFGSRYQARYYYDPTISKKAWPEEKSFICFRLSQEVLMDGGVGEVLAFVHWLTEMLPYSYGYVSPALFCDNYFQDALPYIRRYPGFDVVHQLAAAADIGDRPIGVYWVNIFGPKLSAVLGGQDVLRSSLPDEARVYPCGRGGNCVVLGEAPDVGDANRQNNLPLYRHLAALLRPHLRVPKIIYFKDEYGMADMEAQEAWHKRFFDRD